MECWLHGAKGTSELDTCRGLRRGLWQEVTHFVTHTCFLQTKVHRVCPVLEQKMYRLNSPSPSSILQLHLESSRRLFSLYRRGRSSFNL